MDARGRAGGEAVVKAFDAAPFVVVWEATRACALACVHCRADAIPHRDDDELSTTEAMRLIDRVRAFGDPPPLFVLTGGDPLRRPDVVDLVRYGTAQGLSVALTPSATGAATRARLQALRDAGLARLALSLDGATAESHDAFRGVRGSHAHTRRIIDDARALGLPLQINTTVCRQTVGDLPALAEQVSASGAVLWALFFLIPVGRAQATDALDAAAIERVLEWAADLARTAPFGVKTTEAPHFHRVLAARRSSERPAQRQSSPRDHVRRAGRAVTDGNGFLFVDHRGAICPSGFLSIPAGNVRHDDLVAVYRRHPLFVSLRDAARLGGRCGRCEHRDTCGGSRARAWAATGDPLAEDPGCAYEPVDVDAVQEALGTVLDPELGLSIVELGLLRDVRIDGGRVHVTMTLTTPGCPLHETMSEWIRRVMGRVPGVHDVDVSLTFDPPWTPDQMAVGLARVG
jgi:radical SAM protein